MSTSAQIQMLSAVKKSIDIESKSYGKSTDAVRQAVATIPGDCDIGNFTAVVTRENGAAPTPGDSLRINFNNCVDQLGKIKFNGSVSFVVDVVNNAGKVVGETTIFHPLEATDLDTATNPDVITVTLEGEFSEAITTAGDGSITTSTSTGINGVYIADSIGNVIVEYQDIKAVVIGAIKTVNGTYAVESTALGGRIDLTYNDVSGPINSPYPTSGNMVIVGLDATLTLIFSVDDVTLEALVTIELDLGSDGTVDQTSVITWVNLEQIDTTIN